MRAPSRSIPLTISLSLVAAACLPGPRTYQVVTQAAPSDVYACTLALVDSLGYTVRSSDKASGFLTAERTYQRTVLQLAAFFTQARDQLTVTVPKTGDGGSLRVTTEAEALARNGDEGMSWYPVRASSKAATDANAILQRCGASA